MFPEVKTIITESCRNDDGYYSVSNNQGLAFEFVVDDQIITSMQHTFRNSQDYSLRVWFSEEPFGLMLFSSDDLDVFSMTRNKRYITFYSGDIKPCQEAFKLNPNTKYYINVANLQNAPNGFSMEFC